MFNILIRLGRQVLMALRHTLRRARRTNMTAHASVVVADADADAAADAAAPAGSGSTAFWLKV